MPRPDAPDALVLREEPRETRIRGQRQDNAEKADLVAARPSPSRSRSTRLHHRCCHHRPLPSCARSWQLLSAALLAEKAGTVTATADQAPGQGKPPPSPCHQGFAWRHLWRQRREGKGTGEWPAGGDSGAAAREGGGLPLSELLGDLITP
jgi:hypothetical protein